jgi:hypothetical protein
MPGILPDHLGAPSLRTSNATRFEYAPAGNDAANARTARLLLDAAGTEGFRHKLAMLSMAAPRRLALDPSHRNADHPRAVASSKTEREPTATSEVAPDSISPPPPDNRFADKGAPPSPSK